MILQKNPLSMRQEIAALLLEIMKTLCLTLLPSQNPSPVPLPIGSNVQDLFGMSPAPDTGLLGLKMPSAQNGTQSFPEYNANQQWFSADGIPITPFDDAGVYNPYPLFNVAAIDNSSGALLSKLDVTVPVSTEMTCSSCHNTGESAADAATASKYNVSPAVWSATADSVIQYKENILILHDTKHRTNLAGSTPVLCADCHYSPALDLTGSGPQGAQVSLPLMSHAVHGRHGMSVNGSMPDSSAPPIISDSGKEACNNCHPGKKTQCFRGAMFTAGLNCQNCHGVDLKGTVLSKLTADRVFESDRRQADGSKNIALSKGTEIGCDLCHEMP